MESGGTSDEGLDPESLEEITVAECWRLLATQPVGRVAIIVGHYPLVFPVNYAVVDKTILYRTGLGTKSQAIQRSNVTFEVDEIDIPHRTGWSVMVKGVAQELSLARNRREISQADLGGAHPWAPGDRDHFIRILGDEVTGRRIRLRELPMATDLLGSL